MEGRFSAAGRGELRVMQRCGTMRCEALFQSGARDEWQTDERRQRDDSMAVDEW